MKERNSNSSARAELLATGVSSESNEAPPEARGLSQTMRDPARRKRNASQQTKSQRGSGFVLTNPELQNDGHGGESSSLIKRQKGAKANGKENGSAASDDVSGTTPAEDAPSAAVCMGREAYADVADRNSQAWPDDVSGTDDDRRPRASGGAPLAYDAPGFVEEMHARVNLYVEYQKLLEADDLKVKQRALELLLEMKYGRGAPTGSEEPPLRVDVEFSKPQQGLAGG